METIGINIWDDFYEDGYIPEGEIQKTYAYVEEDMSHEDIKECLDILHNNMLELDLSNVGLSMFFLEGKKRYPSLVGTEHESMLFDRWELRIKNLSHARLNNLVTELNELKLTYKGIPIEVYSES